MLSRSIARADATEMMRSAAVDHLVIVAGGKGERLAQLFPGVPKALAAVGGKPVLAHQLELAKACGIGEVTILAGYLSEQISAFVGDGSAFGVRARVFAETEPLGSAGALIQILDSLPEHFFVLFGDVMAALDLPQMASFHLTHGADFTCLAHPNDHPLDSDLLEVGDDGSVTAIHAYPHPPGRDFANLVNAAVYVVRRDALRSWMGETRRIDFTKDIMTGLIAGNAKVFAYKSVDYAKDMGTPKRLAQVEADWRAGKIVRGQRQRQAAVFLDRDGTLNVEKGGVRRPEELELLPDVGAALAALRGAGFRLVVLTNQPVVARGEASERDLAAIHRRLEWELGKSGAYLDGIYVCPHHPDRGFAGERAELKIACDCRKPALGLFERACRDLSIDAAASWMIGDQTRDIEMARRAGLRSILVQTGAAGGDGRFQCTADHIARDLGGAAEIVIAAKAAEQR
jgi:histidinol-phosphate phosphatase family protein